MILQKPLQQFEIEAIEQVRVGKLPGDVNAVQKKQPPVARVGVPPAGGGSRRRVPPASNLKAANGKGAGDETDEAREAAEAPPDANAKPHRADAAAGPKVRRGTAKRLGLAADETAGAKEHAAEEHADDEEHAAHVDANLRARLKNAAAQKD